MADYVLEIVLPEDRENEGEGYLRVHTMGGEIVYGPFGVLGDTNKIASAVLGRNITGDPLKPYGVTPTGYYTVDRFEYTPRGTRLGDAMSFWSIAETGKAFEYRSYGDFVVMMTPIAGDALRAAENGRTGIWAHGGDLHDGKLRSTVGCLRIRDADLREMYNILSSAREREDAMNRMMCTVFTGEVRVQGHGIDFPGDEEPGVCPDPPPYKLAPPLDFSVNMQTTGGGTAQVRTNVAGNGGTAGSQPFGSSLLEYLGEDVYGSAAYDQAQYNAEFDDWLWSVRYGLAEIGEDFEEEAAGGYDSDNGSGNGGKNNGRGGGGSNGNGGGSNGNGGGSGHAGGGGGDSGGNSDTYDLGTMTISP